MLPTICPCSRIEGAHRAWVAQAIDRGTAPCPVDGIVSKRVRRDAALSTGGTFTSEASLSLPYWPCTDVGAIECVGKPVLVGCLHHLTAPGVGVEDRSVPPIGITA